MLDAFLYPAFLLAASAAVVPVVLHLIQRLRVVRFPFSTIRFLKLASRKAARRNRIENVILLLLRVAAIVLLALAFAMPTLRTRGMNSLLKQTERDIAIVMDASYSMGYGTGTDTTWERSREAAETILKRMGSRDRVCLFLATDHAQPVIPQLSADRDLALGQVRDLLPLPCASRLAPAIEAARRALDEAPDRREREIHVITDGQALPWLDAGGRPARSGTGGGTDIPVFVTLTGAPAPQNIGIQDVELSPPLLARGMPCRLAVRLSRTGAARPGPVTLFVDGKETACRAGEPAEIESGRLTFVLPPMDAGMHAGRAEIAADNVPADNAFHFLLRVEGKSACLCVGSQEKSLFLMKALSAGVGDAPGSRPKRIEAGDLGTEDLSRYACVFLCDALPLPGQAMLQVERYAQSGGVVVLFPGDSAGVKDYEAWRCLPAFPAAIEDVPTAGRRRILRWEDAQHPVLARLRTEPDSAPVVAISRQIRWAKPEPDARVLASAGAGNPFLLGRRVGRGEVLAFSVSPDRSWAAFPLSPFYLPIVRQIVQYGMGLADPAPFQWTGRAFALSEHDPSVTEKHALLDPSGKRVPIRMSSVSNRTVLCAERLDAQGVYSLVWPNHTRTEPAVAVNAHRRESDLTPIARSDVPAALGGGDVRIAEGKDELARLLDEHRLGRTFGEPLLWFALVVALAEALYANWRAKARGGLAAGLEIGPSGRVSEPG
jgi:hypothetical protein